MWPGLSKPVVYYPDLVMDWEQELIQDMENQDFWWYGYSLIGWDPENLPESFEEIWGLLYSRAFFQLPIYYTLAGGLLRQWGRDFPLSQAVTGLRLFGALLFGLSLWGIYRSARALFPDWSRLALAALALAALWPSHLVASATVNNDPLAEVVVVWSIYFAIQILRYGPRPTTFLWFSALILITLFTKRSGFSVLILLLALPLWAWRYYAAKSARRGAAGTPDRHRPVAGIDRRPVPRHPGHSAQLDTPLFPRFGVVRRHLAGGVAGAPGRLGGCAAAHLHWLVRLDARVPARTILLDLVAYSHWWACSSP